MSAFKAYTKAFDEIEAVNNTVVKAVGNLELEVLSLLEPEFFEECLFRNNLTARVTLLRCDVPGYNTKIRISGIANVQ